MLALYFAFYSLALWQSWGPLDDSAQFTLLVEMFVPCTISLFIFLIILAWGASLWYAKRPPAGVYLRGVQIPYGEFVTYDRIDDVRRVVKRVVLLSRDDVVLVPRKGTPTQRGTNRWRIPFKMVGVEGMVTIGKMVVEERELEGKGPAPDLVLYGPAGPGTAVEHCRSERSF